VEVGAADYGVPVPAVIRSGNIMATQFHPEKSGKGGLELLKDFCNGKLGGDRA
jgi:glutamine amidotransferase